jgi:serine phosphatase RsbU (regulator of sigma subunit)
MIKNLLVIVFAFFMCPILNGQNQKEIDSLNKAFKEGKADTLKIKTLVEIFKKYVYVKPDTALQIANKGLSMAQKIKNKLYISQMYNIIGVTYLIKENNTKALENFLIAMKMTNELGNKKTTGTICTNIGIIYLRIGNNKEAQKYFEEGIKNGEAIHDSLIIARNSGNLASLFYNEGDYKKSLDYAFKSGTILKKYELYNYVILQGTIAACYVWLKDYINAEKYVNYVIKMAEPMGIKYALAQAYIGLAVINREKKQIPRSIEYALKGLTLSKEVQNWQFTRDASFNLYLDYNEQNDFKKALEYYEIHQQARDSIFNTEKNKEINGLQLAYERDKHEKDKIISAQKAEKQKLLIIGISIIVLILVFTLTYIYRRLQLTRRQKKIIEQQNKELGEKNEEIAAQSEEIAAQRDNLEVFNEELTEKNEEISAQRDSLNELNNKLTDTNGQLEMLFEIATERKNEIEKKNKDITSSITYASRIQQALLPPSEVLAELLPDHFIMYKPCNIVSGDFYWSKQIENYIYIVAADCTGHGVPGAFMSMLGISLLNDIVKDKVLMQPHVILNKLRDRIKKSLHQTGQKGETQDGMDIAIIVLDLKNKKIDFAGAYNPLYLYRKGIDGNFEFFEAKADRMPIGIHPKDEQSFTSQALQLQPGDSVYLFSDGYISQFGGQKRETFKSRRLQETLMQIQHKPMKEQKQELEKTLANWQGKHEQVDDILMIGLRVN